LTSTKTLQNNFSCIRILQSHSAVIWALRHVELLNTNTDPNKRDAKGKTGDRKGWLRISSILQNFLRYWAVFLHFEANSSFDRAKIGCNRDCNWVFFFVTLKCCSKIAKRKLVGYKDLELNEEFRVPDTAPAILWACIPCPYITRDHRARLVSSNGERFVYCQHIRYIRYVFEIPCMHTRGESYGASSGFGQNPVGAINVNDKTTYWRHLWNIKKLGLMHLDKKTRKGKPCILLRPAEFYESDRLNNRNLLLARLHSTFVYLTGRHVIVFAIDDVRWLVLFLLLLLCVFHLKCLTRRISTLGKSGLSQKDFGRLSTFVPRIFYSPTFKGMHSWCRDV